MTIGVSERGWIWWTPISFVRSLKVARAIVDELLPSDLAAVVFTKNNRGAQEFTSDRALLLAAIESFRFGWVPEMRVLSQAMSAGVLRDAIQVLGKRAQGPSAIMWISVGGGIADMPDVTRRSSDAGIVAENENLNAREEREALIAEQIGLSAISSESRLARVPVYGFSIAGLHAAGTASCGSRFARGWNPCGERSASWKLTRWFPGLIDDAGLIGAPRSIPS